MAKDYIEYLSASVLNDGQTVSYRTLSRALKVHSNLAKQMLFDFHHIQNSKKAGTLHATYLITATQKIQPQSQSQENGTQDQGVQDTAMRSSPLPSSSAPVTQDPQSDSQEYVATLVTLVDQDHLEDAKAQFDELLSIHVYSVQPGKIKDLQVLCECNRAIATTYATEDPLEASKQYGTIQNSNVKRRAFRKPQQQQQPPAQKSAPPPTTKAAASATKAASTFVSNMAAEKNISKPTTSKKPAETAPAPAPAAASSKSTTAKAAPALVKRESSSLFKAFAKAKPKAQSQNTESSAEPSPAPGPEAKEDEPMQDLSDEEANDEDAAMFDEGALKDPTGKSKKEREDDLRRMMDMEDEPMTDAPPETPTEPEPEPTPSTSQTATENPPPAESTETVTVTNGRRRGKRRVMKKKTVKDEEGYLVTREEAAWESFSEDEPVAKKPKVSVAAPAAVAKGKKGGAQKGQGSIMSFFSKK